MTPARAQHHHERAEHLQHHVAGHHVGEQPHRQRDQPRQVGKHLDRHQQRHQRHRHALRHEIAEEMPAVDAESDERHQPDHEHRQRQRHGDMAGEGEEQREDAQQVAEQDEEEQREDEREDTPGPRVRWFPCTCPARSRRPSRRPIAAGPAPSRAGACRPTAGRSVSTPATTIIRLAWVKFTDAPMWPSAGSSLNWPSASIDPPAATYRPLSCVVWPRRRSWREHAPDVQYPSRAAQQDEHRGQDGLGAEQPIEPVADGDRHDQGRDQLDPHPQADPPWGSCRPCRRIPCPTLAAGRRAPACCGRLSASPRRRRLVLARFLAHVRSWQVAPPEGGGLLQGGPDSVKNATSARQRHIRRVAWEARRGWRFRARSSPTPRRGGRLSRRHRSASGRTCRAARCCRRAGGSGPGAAPADRPPGHNRRADAPAPPRIPE